MPCSGPGGGAAGLVAAISAANAAGRGSISLAPRCTYTLTAADNGSFGGNGLPVIIPPITIAGAQATIAHSSAQPFRIFEVDGPGGGIFNDGGTLLRRPTSRYAWTGHLRIGGAAAPGGYLAGRATARADARTDAPRAADDWRRAESWSSRA